MSCLRINDVERDRITLPIGQDLDQFASINMIAHGKGDRLSDTDAGKGGGHVASELVDRNHVVEPDLDLLFSPPELHRKNAALIGLHVADAEMSVVEIAGMPGNAHAFEIDRGRIGPQFEIRHLASDERLIGRRPGPQRTVDILGNVVDNPVANVELQLDFRVARVEVTQRRHDDAVRKGPG